MIDGIKRWLRAPVTWKHYAVAFAAFVAGYWVMAWLGY